MRDLVRIKLYDEPDFVHTYVETQTGDPVKKFVQSFLGKESVTIINTDGREVWMATENISSVRHIP